MNRTKIEWCDYDQGWLSAIIDGEGSISLLKESRPQFINGFTYKPRICVTGKCIGIINKAREIIGVGAIVKNKETGVYTLDISANGCRTILKNIKFIEKPRQAELLKQALIILSKRCGRGIGSRSKEDSKLLDIIATEIRRLNKL